MAVNVAKGGAIKYRHVILFVSSLKIFAGFFFTGMYYYIANWNNAAFISWKHSSGALHSLFGYSRPIPGTSSSLTRANNTIKCET